MIAGRIWKFGDDINTDLMLPAALMTKSEPEQARAVFSANRPGWVDQIKRGDGIVAGQNFGMGSNRPASRSLRNLGIGFLLAESVNGLFFRNSVNFGFLALECSGCFAAFDESDTAELDLAAWRVRNSRSGVMLTPARIPDRLLALMQGGGIFPLMEKEGLIAPQSSAV